MAHRRPTAAQQHVGGLPDARAWRRLARPPLRTRPGDHSIPDSASLFKGSWRNPGVPFRNLPEGAHWEFSIPPSLLVRPVSKNIGKGIPYLGFHSPNLQTAAPIYDGEPAARDFARAHRTSRFNRHSPGRLCHPRRRRPAWEHATISHGR
jgi:hypothetical protein